MKRLLSGVKPTGRPHIGNYFGAMKQFVDLQHDHECFFFIADYHALNSIQDGAVMKDSIINLFIDYLAIGLDHTKSTIYKQSDITAHTELAWIFDTLATMPYLMRAHAFKDADAKDKEISVGVFNYPMLMAADILLYDAQVVPVGKDQQQHVEIARDMARKFNNTYSPNNPIFLEPQAKIISESEVVLGTDGQKMSKSYGNTIPLFATTDEIVSAVKTITTDSKTVEEPKNPDDILIYNIHKNIISGTPRDETVRKMYLDGGLSYKVAKDMLIEDLEAMIAPMREKRALISANQDEVMQMLKNGGERAQIIAQEKMNQVKESIGVKFY